MDYETWLEIWQHASKALITIPVGDDGNVPDECEEIYETASLLVYRIRRAYPEHHARYDSEYRETHDA